MNNAPLVAQGVFLLACLALIAADAVLFPAVGRFRLSRGALLVISAVALVTMTALAVEQVRFPLHLEVMEGTVLAHFERALAGQAVYPDPSPAFVALAYNPLYYYVSAPFSTLFGISLLSLRLSSVVALAGSVLVTYALVRRRTGSAWWGVVAAGLFAAAAGGMDTYLVTAHSDSWFLFMVLLGSALIDRDRGKAWNVAGLLFLLAGFWFKQHGALFTAGGVLFLTFREMTRRGWWPGLRASLVYWVLVVLLGPVLYIFAGPTLFGPQFHYFTWKVPSQWSEFAVSTLYRLGTFVLRSYAIPALAAGAYVLWAVLRPVRRVNIVHVQVVFAGLSALMGALDGGSANNVFIPMGTWFLIAAVLGLHELTRGEQRSRLRTSIAMASLFGAFALLIYNPLAFRPAPGAQAAYADFVAMLDGLHGLIYSPDVAELEQSDRLFPNAHWVALEDLIRGPGRDTRNNPVIRDLLAPLLDPEGSAYVLTNTPLEEKDVLAFLLEDYTLDTDFGDRFAALSTQPGRFFTGYPRYLYRFVGPGAPPA